MELFELCNEAIQSIQAIENGDKVAFAKVRFNLPLLKQHGVIDDQDSDDLVVEKLERVTRVDDLLVFIPIPEQCKFKSPS